MRASTRARAHALAPALALALALAAPLAAAQQEMARPEWRVGDEWAYVVTFDRPLPNGTTEKAAHVGKRLVAARENVTVGGAHHDTFRIIELIHDVPAGEDPLALSGMPLDFSGGATVEWVRVLDGETVKSLRLRQVRVGDIILQGPVRTYPEGCDTFGWPLAVGKDETRECRIVTNERGREAEGLFHPSTSVVAREIVSVPAGNFTAYVADMGAEGVIGERQWYAPDACWRVKARSAANNVTMQLVGYRCGERTLGALNAADPPLEIDRLTQPRPAPGLGVLALVALGAGLAIAQRRKTS